MPRKNDHDLLIWEKYGAFSIGTSVHSDRCSGLEIVSATSIQKGLSKLQSCEDSGSYSSQVTMIRHA